jgi:hypothetical protein
MLTLSPESHTDHALTPAHLAWVLANFADREGFFLATVELPADLPSLPCGLHGPAVGGDPVAESEVTYAVRGGRKVASRLCDRTPQPSRLVTVIAGPWGDKPCVLWTAFGGPAAPREPGDPALSSWEEVVESCLFWAEHALSRLAQPGALTGALGLFRARGGQAPQVRGEVRVAEALRPRAPDDVRRGLPGDAVRLPERERRTEAAAVPTGAARAHDALARLQVPGEVARGGMRVA